MRKETRNGLTAVSVGMDEIRKVSIVQLGGETMNQWYEAQKDKPDLMMNASLWDTKGAIGTIWQDGKLVRNEGSGFGFGIDKAGACGFGDPWENAWMDYLTGYPALVKGGKSLADSVDRYVMTAHTKRSVIAAAGNRLYFVTADSMTIAQLRGALVGFGVHHAINLDGGGSSRLLVNGEAINKPTDNRRCPNAIAVWLKEEKEEKPMGKRVFLGVGHGGKDPGASGGGMEEKDITLTMALACKKELERHGVTVGMSRTKDEDDPLTEEIRECNAFDPEVAVDIHVNAGGGDGFEAYYSKVGGLGKTLAECIESEVKTLGQNSRGCKTRINGAGKDYYGFVRSTRCPAVICEIGFLDNDTDRAAFDTKAEQEAFGRAYAHGILAALGIQKHEEEHWAQKAYDSLIAKGVKIHETRFDDQITRGEVLALLDQIVKP